MLPKKNRADKKAIEKIFKDGGFFGSSGLNFKYILNKALISPKISFIAPKSVEKQAVLRNKLKRQGYIALKKYFNKIPNGLSGVFIFNKIKGEKTTIKKIEKEIEYILNRVKFIKDNK